MNHPPKAAIGKQVLLALGLVFVVGLGAVWLAKPAYPSARGKTLPEWFADSTLQEVGLMTDAPSGPATGTPPYEAILEMRGEAVPFLTRVARRRPSKLAGSYDSMVKPLPAAIRKALPAGQNRAAMRSRQMRALVMLGALVYWEARPRPWGNERRPLDYPSILATVRYCLHDSDLWVRNTAAVAAGYLQRRGEILVPDLVQLLRSTNGVDQVAAAGALGMIGDKRAVPDLINLLPPHERFTPIIVWALGQLAPEATNAIPALVRLVPKATDTERMRIASALGDMGYPSAEALNALVAILKTDDMFAQREAALAFVQIGVTPPEAIPQLSVLTSSWRALQVRQAAALAIWTSDRANPGWVAGVSNAIQEDPYRGLAWLHQCRLDNRAAALIPLVQSLTEASEPRVSMSATQLLLRLQR